jgi:hypothetical protein
LIPPNRLNSLFPFRGRPFRARLSSAPPVISPGTIPPASQGVRRFRRRMSLWIWFPGGRADRHARGGQNCSFAPD